MHPPFAAPGSKSSPRMTNVEALPSIQEFLDELPSIEDFVDPGAAGLPPIAEYDADGWAVAGWQDFDWTGAATLGARSHATDEANSAWDTIDWNVPSRASQSASRAGHPTSSADEVASALDGIARRIRSGELSIDQLSGTPPEAAMAAALASLLRMRD